MFYLKEFLKSIGDSPIRGTTFLFLSCLFAISLTHRPWIAHSIEKITPEKMVNPYFVAVVDGSVDAEKIKGVLAKLPGVLIIDDNESDRSRTKLNTLIGQLGSEYKLDETFMNFKSLRVVLSPSLSVESLEFVRNQVVKMGGQEHVTATDIKYPEVAKVMNAHPFYGFLSKAGDWGVVGVLAIFWIISYWICYDVFRSRSYIIEKYQRRKLVAAKTIAAGLGLISILFTSFGIWNDTLKVFDSIILLMVFSIFWTFSMQEWRWKPTI
jgi:hypothetical protein